jgi:phosphoribosylanthranilate isomerase
VSAIKHPVRVKICGITRVEDAQAAAATGADAIGMVFYPKSPRCNSIPQAAKIARSLPPFVCRVGLFVNPSVEEVAAVLAAVPLEMLQFHGDEDPAFCKSFDRPWLKAARVAPGLDLVEYAARFAAAGASGLVLDACTADYGGAGVSFDWSLIPRNLPLPLILAGGLNPDNVAQAIAKVAPSAVDVSSGVEGAGAPKGIKDAALIASFIAQAKAGAN